MPVDLLFSDVVDAPARCAARKWRARCASGCPASRCCSPSGYTDNAIVHSGRLDEGIELLSKPYTREALARKVRLVLVSGGAELGPALAEALAGGNRRAEYATYIATGTCNASSSSRTTLARASTAELMRTFGLSVVEASTDAEAMAVLREGPVDVLLTDVGLSGASGVDPAMDACRLQPARCG